MEEYKKVTHAVKAETEMVRSTVSFLLEITMLLAQDKAYFLLYKNTLKEANFENRTGFAPYLAVTKITSARCG